MPAQKDPDKITPERAERMAEIARLSRMGLTQREIAARVRVTQPQVQKDLQLVIRGYTDQAQDDWKAHVVRTLETLRDVRREAYLAWERSKEDATKSVEKKTPKKTKGEDGEDAEDGPRELLVRELVSTVEGRLPANQYLATILDTISQERALLGLDAPTKHDVRAAVAVVPWDELYGAVVPEGDAVEAAILRAALPGDESDDGDGQ